jgi:hypothetical protein
MFVLSFLALSAFIASALSVPQPQQIALNDQETVAPERYLIETSPGETQWVTEDYKWVLRQVRPSFDVLPRLSRAILTLRRTA